MARVCWDSAQSETQMHDGSVWRRQCHKCRRLSAPQFKADHVKHNVCWGWGLAGIYQGQWLRIALILGHGSPFTAFMPAPRQSPQHTEVDRARNPWPAPSNSRLPWRGPSAPAILNIFLELRNPSPPPPLFQSSRRSHVYCGENSAGQMVEPDRRRWPNI